MDDLYPPSPQNVPAKLTEPSPSYIKQTRQMLAGIFLFLAVYLSLLIFCGYAFWQLIHGHAPQILQSSLFLYVMCAVVTGMLFIFILKGLFKYRKFGLGENIELKEKDHPQLFAFIRTLASETGAPFPKKVVVNTDINAAVYYNSTVLSIFIPVKKNLLIGMGLVNTVNLSEFKAILAHEFGHFSQKTMTFGSYMYVAHRVIYDMVYQRDYWDKGLAIWSRLDFRLAIFAWILYPIVWLVRKIFEAIYFLLHRLNSSLSREMEFNADLVAVSVTGSIPIISGLSKLNQSGEAFSLITSNLVTASDEELYSDDIFHHHQLAIKHLASTDHFKHEVDAIKKEDRIFDPNFDRIPQMYDSHPPNYQREDNARATFIEGAVDERSPWLLFNDSPVFRKQLSQAFYKENLEIKDRLSFTKAADVQNYIQEEWEETSYDPRYQGIYEDRYLFEIDLNTLAELPLDNVKQELKDLYGEKLAKRMAAYRLRQKEMGKIAEIIQAPGSVNTFDHRNETYVAAEAPNLLKSVGMELEEDTTWFNVFDQKVIELHYNIARQQPTALDEFTLRYQFHYKLQETHKLVSQQMNELYSTIHELNSGEKLDEQDVAVYEAKFRKLDKQLRNMLADNSELLIYPMKNIKAGEKLMDHLLSGEYFLTKYNFNKYFSTEWINGYLAFLGKLNHRLKRLYFKSLGGILTQQEKLMADHYSAGVELSDRN